MQKKPIVTSLVAPAGLAILLVSVWATSFTASAQSGKTYSKQINYIPRGVGDKGYERPRFLADVNGDDLRDYCRMVGSGKETFFACQLGKEGGGFEGEDYGFNSEQGIDFGQADSQWMEDVNSDGRADFCRKNSSGVMVALLAEEDAFARKDVRIRQVGSRWRKY